MMAAEFTRILVTGGRHYRDRQHVYEVLDGLYARFGPLLVVHGGARGADTLADDWVTSRKARGLAVDREVHEARWYDPCRQSCRPGHRKARGHASSYCPAAGEYRNHEMGDLGARGFVAFPDPGSVGTHRMINYAKAKGIPDLLAVA